MVKLSILEGLDKGKSFSLGSDLITFGRSSQNSIILSDVHVSTNHAILRKTGDTAYTFEDLQSTNGSSIIHGDRVIELGVSLNSSLVFTGDRLCIGDQESPVIIKFEILPQIDIDTDNSGVITLKKIQDLPDFSTKHENDLISIKRVYQFSKNISGGLDLNQILETIADQIFQIYPNITNISIILKDKNSEKFIPVLTRGKDNTTAGKLLPMSKSIINRVITEKASILAANALEELGSTASIINAKILSTMCVPLWSGEEIIGVIQVDNRASAGMFHEVDLELLTIIASHISLAIQNALLFHSLKIAQDQLKKENVFLKAKEASRVKIIGNSEAMRRIFRILEKVINTKVTVCIEGETGTGKELIAQMIHYQSERREKLFVAQNCTALPDSLLESELFGHKKGSFTGADADKKGLFEIADGGTIFLDEIGETSLNMQTKLLRVLQEGEIRPVGALYSKTVDIRIVSATNKNLEEEVKTGRFRQDLYYRLKVFPIKLPPLRERIEDIPLLANHFLRKYCEEMKRDIAGFSQEAFDYLMNYAWPGNIRELENETQRIIIQGVDGNFVLPEHLSSRIRKVESVLDKVGPVKGTLKEMMDQVEKFIIVSALRENDGNKSRCALKLGITREGLHKKINKYCL